MRKKEIIKNRNGITLVSLVITIIVLIILAAVTINLTIGTDGIITRARQASENMELAAIEEQESLNQLYAQFNFEGSSTQVGDSTGQGSSSSTSISNETIRYNAQTDMIQLKDANGNWVDWKIAGLLWDGYLYNYGLQNYEHAGGISKNNTTSGYASYTVNSNYVEMKTSSGEGIYINSGFDNPIDLTNYNKVVFKGQSKTNTTALTNKIGIGINNTTLGANSIFTGCERSAFTSENQSTTLTDFVVELDVSDIVGERYIYVEGCATKVVNGGYLYVNIEEIYVE